MVFKQCTMIAQKVFIFCMVIMATLLFYYYFSFYHSQVFVNYQSAICLSRYIILETFKKICN